MPSTTDFGFFIVTATSLYYAFINFSQLQFIAVAIILSILTSLLTSGGPSRKMPPGPAGIPIFGSMPWFLFNDPKKYLNKLRKKYGKIFTIRIGSINTHIISDYEMIKEMGNHPDFQNRPQNGAMRKIINRRGIIATESNVWKHQRRFILHTLKDDEIIRLCLVIEKAHGIPIDLSSLLKSSTCNMIFSLAFNKSFEYDNPKFLKRIEKLDENIKSMGRLQMILFFPWLVPFFSGMIQRIKNTFIKEHQNDFDPENPRDFIDLYLIEMSKELQYVIGDLFAAGTETSSTTISWALLFMIHHPKIQEKVQAEIDEVIGKERLPKMEDKPLLPFTTATLQEIERLASVVPGAIQRSNDKPAEFTGYKFPEKSNFLFDLYSIHRDPAYWKNPLDFDPNRFIDKNGKVFRPPHLLAFGSGKRNCVGESMAKMEIFLLFVTLLQKFTFEQDGNGLPNLDNRSTGIINPPISHKLRAISRKARRFFEMPSITDFGFFIALITSLYYAFINLSQFQFIAVAITLSISTYLLIFGGPGRKMPPGPTGIPILGNMPWLLFNDSNKYFNKLHKKYGKIFTVRIGSSYTYIISDYEMIKMMSNDPNFQYRPEQGILRKLANRRGILDAEGDVWKHQRRFVLHTLRDVGMGKLKLEEKIHDEITKLCFAIEKSNGLPMDPKLLILSTTSNMICSLAYNKSFELDDPKFLKTIETLDQNFQASEEFIEEHQHDFDPENPRDFVDLYLREMSNEVTEDNKDAQKTFNIEQLQFVVRDLFGAGTETSSTTVRWGLLFMIHHPKIQQKVQAEIDEVIGKERLPTMADKRLLPFTTATLQEFHAYSVHRDPTYWKNPLDFDPNRFIDKEGKVFRPPYLMPFGSGKRVCVGESMAKMEIFLLFVTLLQKFTFEQDGNGLPTLENRPRGVIRTPISHKLRAISRSK
ncbi:Cytochrome P450 2J6 [Nymphon striatum]|nr:Cytochrome P450 2J6 [Nymphon striatum]